MRKGILIIAMTFLPLLALADQPFFNYGEPTTFTSSTTSAQALPADTYRRFLFIQNTGGTSVHIKFGSAHSGTEGIVLVAGAYVMFDKAPINSVYIKSASGTPTVTLQVGK